MKISILFIIILLISRDIEQKTLVKTEYYDTDCQSNLNMIVIREYN